MKIIDGFSTPKKIEALNLPPESNGLPPLLNSLRRGVAEPVLLTDSAFPTVCSLKQRAPFGCCQFRGNFFLHSPLAPLYFPLKRELRSSPGRESGVVRC